jgi:hypothetical protein
MRHSATYSDLDERIKEFYWLHTLIKVFAGVCFIHDLLYNNRPVHFIKKALRKCLRERANFRRGKCG